MRWTINIALFLVVFLGACKSDKQEDKGISDAKINGGYLLEIDEVVKLNQQPNIKFIDFRKPETYAKGHIPNAINIWRTSIEDTNYPYQGMMASKLSLIHI